MDSPGCSFQIEDRQNSEAARKYKASIRPWDIRSADESSRLQHPSEDRDQFLFQFQARRHQIQEGNSAVSAYDAAFNSGVIKRISLAGFPATMALSGTS